MATKTIRITEEVYDRLEARKREDESFTDLLARLTKQERDIYAGFGAWEGTDRAERMRATHNELNEELNADAEGFRQRADGSDDR